RALARQQVKGGEATGNQPAAPVAANGAIGAGPTFATVAEIAWADAVRTAVARDAETHRVRALRLATCKRPPKIPCSMRPTTTAEMLSPLPATAALVTCEREGAWAGACRRLLPSL